MLILMTITRDLKVRKCDSLPFLFAAWAGVNGDD